MKTFNLIKPIKKELEEKMHEVCVIFCTIGTPRETPRYYNIRQFKNNILTIGSTQNQDLFFNIDCSNIKEFQPDKDFTILFAIRFNDFWSQFKEFRTEFLKENYPTIDTK